LLKSCTTGIWRSGRRITTTTYVDVRKLAREVIADIGSSTQDGVDAKDLAGVLK